MSFRLLLVTAASAAVASAVPALVGRFWAASAWACFTVDCSELHQLGDAVDALGGRLDGLDAVEMPSSRPLSWLERSFSEAAVK